MLVRMARLNLAAGRVTACRMLCSAPRKTWDPNANVHGRAGAAAEVVSDDTSEIDEAPSTPRRARNYPRGAGAASSYLAARAGGGAARDTERSTGGRAEMLQFQSFVRQRLAQMAHRLPSTPSVRESAELAYLEEQAVESPLPLLRRSCVRNAATHAHHLHPTPLHPSARPLLPPHPLLHRPLL